MLALFAVKAIASFRAAVPDRRHMAARQTCVSQTQNQRHGELHREPAFASPLRVSRPVLSSRTAALAARASDPTPHKRSRLQCASFLNAGAMSPWFPTVFWRMRSVERHSGRGGMVCAATVGNPFRWRKGMSVELKSLVERLVHDAAFRKAFLAKPEVILDALPVALAERR